MDFIGNEIEVITGFDREMRAHALPIWFESLVGADFTLLHLAPVYYGFGVKRGDGAPVIVVPGFLGSDFYLYELYYWLGRIGYAPYMSGIGWNADCLNKLSEKLVATIRRANEETGRKAHLIGHSLGGVLSRSAATQFPDLVESVTTLGSPFRGVRSHPKVIEISEKVRRSIFKNDQNREYPNCYTGHCDCATIRALHEFLPAQLKQTAIYTKSDGIVDWKNCRSRFESNNFEVTGTHIGLVYNFQVYKLIAERLAS